jgi:DNA invertase Pin-like site-specific DNA recombinase
MTIVALYARVSTKDKGQSTENRLPKLRHFGLVPFI